jgi:hypothetical protein
MGESLKGSAGLKSAMGTKETGRRTRGETLALEEPEVGEEPEAGEQAEDEWPLEEEHPHWKDRRLKQHC